MTQRERLANRRAAETFALEHAVLKYTVTISRFADGRIAEAFIANHKRGNASDVAARDGGILLSLLLQHGCPLETIARALSRNGDGSASGVNRRRARQDQLAGEGARMTERAIGGTNGGGTAKSSPLTSTERSRLARARQRAAAAAAADVAPAVPTVAPPCCNGASRPATPSSAWRSPPVWGSRRCRPASASQV